jgi:outer membrane protein assembly factor BamB
LRNTALLWRSPALLRQKLIRRGAIGLLALFAVLGLAGCGTTPEMVWPGLNTAGDTVYLTSPDGWLRALETDSGELRWEFPNPDSSEKKKSLELHASPAIAGDLLFVGTYVYNGPNRLYALDINNGQEKWSIEIDGPIVGSAAIEDGKVFIGSSDNHLYCFESATGNPCWDSPFAAKHWVWSSPLLVGGRIFIATMDHNLYCVDAAQGTPCWATPYEATGALAGSPAFAEDTIYVGDFDGALHAVDATTGQQKWTFKAGNWIWGGPVVADGLVYFGALDGKVYALDAISGEKVWERAVEGRVRAPPTFADGLLYVGSEGGHLYAIDAASGQVRWDFPIPADGEKKRRILTAPVVNDSLIFAVSMDGQVYALDAVEGTQEWVYSPPSG